MCLEAPSGGMGQAGGVGQLLLLCGWNGSGDCSRHEDCRQVSCQASRTHLLNWERAVLVPSDSSQRVGEQCSRAKPGVGRSEKNQHPLIYRWEQKPQEAVSSTRLVSTKCITET